MGTGITADALRARLSELLAPSALEVIDESYLHEGSQPVPKNLAELKHGVSVTDACISWETTERILHEAHQRLAKPAPVLAA